MRFFSLADRFAFIVAVNKGIKPPDYWAGLLQMPRSTIHFNLWTCPAAISALEIGLFARMRLGKALRTSDAYSPLLR
jgi:hypothetical protein